MIEVRKAHERGRANFGWLDSAHTFSFGSYYDAEHMGFSALRVINDDRVAPAAGFDTHGHRDMEIISFVTQGVIEHKDSMGNIQTLPKGEFQLMSAGKGVYHSEYNASGKEELKFLQIWIVPDEQGGKPGYQQKEFGREQGLTKVVTPDGENGTLRIRQDAALSQLILAPETAQTLTIKPDRKAYIHLVEGQVILDAHELQPGDGVKLADIAEVTLQNPGDETVTALVFDLP